MGFAVQLCYMRYPGIVLSINETPFFPLLNLVADQLKMSVNVWGEYGKRDQTRREHLAELQTIFGFQTFSMGYYQSFVSSLADLAWQTDKGIVLASALVQSFISH
jgi:TnpA family transposase